MSRIDDLLAEQCPEGVALKPVGEVATVGTGRSDRKDSCDDGAYPFYVRSKEILRIDSFEFDEEAIVIPGEGGIGEIFHFVSGKYALHQRAYRISFNSPKIETKFAYYYFSTHFKRFILQKAVNATVSSIRKPMIMDFPIPVPPLEVQREIVRVLDQFTQLEVELKAELEARRRQFDHYRRMIMAPASHWVTTRLGDVVEFQNAKAHERLIDPDGDTILLTAGFISAGVIKARFVRSEDVLTPALLDDVALVMSDLPKGRALAKAFFVDKKNMYAANQRVCLLRPKSTNQLDPKFLYYTVNRNAQLLAYDSGVDQTHLKKDWILDVRIGIPPVEEQRRIVKTLDEFNALVNDLRAGLPAELAARRKQYEYYRDRLLTFKEAAA